MTRLVVAYGATLIAFLAIDAAYLGTVGGRMFRATLGDVMAPSFSITPAILFYALYPIGLLIFAVLPALDAGRWTGALLSGALFGFFAYVTYDMTNWATIRNWTPTLVIVDLTWGTFVSGVAATIGFFAVRFATGAN